MEDAVDLSLLCCLRHLSVGIDGGIDAFLSLLRDLDDLSAFGMGWTGRGARLWNDVNLFIERTRDQNLADYAPGDRLDVHAGSTMSGPDAPSYYVTRLTWEVGDAERLSPDQLTLDIRRPSAGRRAILAEDYFPVIEHIVMWQGAQHIRFGPSRYSMKHHPLDRTRLGIGWMGWLPFDVSASDVPEAEVVTPLAGGTLVMPVRAFWQAFERHPLYSRDAIERAQEVEMRLNLLGVLPTAAELNAGTWGSLP